MVERKDRFIKRHCEEGVRNARWHGVKARTSSQVSESQGPGDQGVEELLEGLVGTAGGSVSVTAWLWVWAGHWYPEEALNSGTGQRQAEGGPSRTTGAQLLCLG